MATADVCRKHGISERDVLQVEGEVRRPGCVRRQAAEGARGRERQAEEAAGRGDARQRDPEGRQLKKMVTPAVEAGGRGSPVQAHEVSERRACQVIGVDRSTIRYRSPRPDDATVRERIRELASRTAPVRLSASASSAEAGRHGDEPEEVPAALSARRACRCASAAAASGPLGTRAPHCAIRGPNERWSLDFVSDSFTDGRRFRILAVVDDCTRECLAWSPTRRSRACAWHANSSASSPARQAADDDRLRQWHRTDQHGDPGLAQERRCRLALHRAGQAAAERLHRELQRHASATSAERDAVLVARRGPHRTGRWRRDYNTNRPHSGLGWLTPSEFADRIVQDKQWLGRCVAGLRAHGHCINRPTGNHEAETLQNAGS